MVFGTTSNIPASLDGRTSIESRVPFPPRNLQELGPLRFG